MMVESDQGDGKTEQRASTEMPHETPILKQKRPRAESSEDETSKTPLKKHCGSDSDETYELQGELNGKSNNHKDLQSTEIKKELESGEVPMKKEEIEQKDGGTFNERTNVNENEEMISEEKVVQKTEEDLDVDGRVDNSKTHEQEKEEDEEEEDEDMHNDTGVTKNSIKSKKNSGSEVVEGLELSVECASENESSSSESKEEEVNKPKPKITIVKAKPTDSELEIGSSEMEKSDEEEAASSKSPKQTGKKGRKKGARKSFSKAKNTSSEESHDSDISDEDYSPRAKKKLKKSKPGRKPKGSPEPKRGRGRAKKTVEKVEEEEDNGDSTEDIQDNKIKHEKEEPDEQSGSQSDNNSEADSVSKKRGRRSSTSNTSGGSKRIESLKKYIRAAGIHVKSYNELFENCKSNAAKIRCLQELLEKNGMTGRPTLEKCKKLKQRKEALHDISELNTKNIISEARITRAQRNLDSNKNSTKASGSPPKHREARNSFKRIMSVVDSDSE